MPRAWKTSSASGQVGPLAASTMTLAWTALAMRRVEDAAERGGDQDVDGHRQELLVGAGVAPLEADDLAVDGDVPVELGDVDPLGIDDRTVGVGDGDDLAPLLRAGTGRCGCRRCRSPGWRRSCPAIGPLEPREHLAGDDRHAVAGGRLAAGRAVELDRLAGHAGRVEPVDTSRIRS